MIVVVDHMVQRIVLVEEGSKDVVYLLGHGMSGYRSERRRLREHEHGRNTWLEEGSCRPARY